MSDYPHITYKKHTFLSALAMGFSAIVITLVISGTVILIYGIHFAGEKSERLVTLAEDAVRGLPELQKSLPPVLADVLDDRRQPDYCKQLEITARTKLLPDRHGMMCTEFQITNNGSQVVSLLSLRVVVFNTDNEIIAESNEWAATPFTAEHEWRGPLIPGSNRHFTSYTGRRFPFSSIDDLKTEVEVTDIRVWNAPNDTPSIEEQASPGTETTKAEHIQLVEI
jgi:hypothetical protein